MKNIQKHTEFHLKKGALHRDMHVAQGKKIPVAALHHELAIAKKEGNTTLEKRVLFALNARKFKH
jgi:hypothetical protein